MLAIAQRQAQAFSLAQGVQVTLLLFFLLNVFPSDCMRRCADKQLFTWTMGLGCTGRRLLFGAEQRTKPLSKMRQIHVSYPSQGDMLFAGYTRFKVAHMS